MRALYIHVVQVLFIVTTMIFGVADEISQAPWPWQLSMDTASCDAGHGDVGPAGSSIPVPSPPTTAAELQHFACVLWVLWILQAFFAFRVSNEFPAAHKMVDLAACA